MDPTSTVLVVDDDLAMRRALEDLLTAEGYDVTCASTGAEALEKATQLTPDLILLDVMMPDMDGFTVCQHLRTDPLLAEVPVIIVTALADRDSRLRGLEAGADDYVSKPIDTPELLARVRTTTRLNRYRRLLEEQTQRQQAEAALRESEERFRNLVENMPIVCFMFDQQGRILSWNRAAERVYGYTKDVAVGANAYDLIVTPATREDTDQVIQEVFAGKTIEGSEWQDRDKMGQIGWRMGNTFPLRSADGSVERGVNLNVDITERKRAEEALRESEEIFRSVVEQSNDGIVLADEQGTIIEWNRGAEQIFGLQRDEALGQSIWDVQFQAIPEERRTTASYEQLKASILGFLRTEQAPWLGQLLEMEIRRPGGEHRTVQTLVFHIKTGQGSMLGSISRDITEAKRAEEALRKSERKYRELYENLRDGSVAVDMNGRFTEFNRTYQERLGYPAEELAHLRYQDITPEKWHSIEARIIEEQVLKRGYSDLYEKEYIRKDGTIFPVELRAYLIQDNHGTPTGMWAIVRDITERRQAEEVLRRERDRAQRYLDVAGVMMLVLNELGEIVLINRRGCQILGYEEKTLIGQNWFDTCLPASIREETKSAFEQLMADKVEAVESFENPVLTSSGEERLIAWHNTVLKDAEGRITGTLSSGEDITERKQAEEARQRYAERLGILHEVDRSILTAQSPQTIARAAVTHIRQLIPCQRVDVMLFDSPTREMTILAVDTAVKTKAQEGIRARFDRFGDEIDQLREDRVVILEDFQPRGEITAAMRDEGVRSLASVPLTYQGELIGSLNLGMSRPDDLTFEHIDVARQVADQLAIAIQQARLHEQVERHAEELEQRVVDRTQELSVLYKVAALATQSLDLETTLARSLEAALEAVGNDAGAIHLLDEADETSVDGVSEGGVLRLTVQRDIPPDLKAQIGSLPSGEGLGKRVVERDEPLIIPDITLDPRETVTLLKEPHVYVGMPLRAGGQASGMLSVARRMDQPRFNLEELSLLTSVADQLGIVVESARLRKRAERAAVLEERERLARDLHDSVTQLLYSVNLFARSARNAHSLGDGDELDHCLTELGEAGQQALKEMRLMVYELRPRALEREGLIGAIQHRLDAVEGRVGVATQLLVGEMIDLPERMEQDLYHITIEALNNALKYAKATSVTVSLDAGREGVRLEVTDDGSGFDLHAVEGKGGLGIVGMRERAERLGGALQVISTPDEGTSVRATLSMEEL